MNKHLLPVAAVLALASVGTASAGTITTSYYVEATASVAAPTGTQGAFGGATGPYQPTVGVTPGGIGYHGIIDPLLGLVYSAGGPTVSFVAPSNTTSVSIFVEDQGFPGDVYQVFLNGSSLGQTPSVPLDDETPSDGPWSETTFSSVPFAIGLNTISAADILIQYEGQTSPYGFNNGSDFGNPDCPDSPDTICLSHGDPNGGTVTSDVDPAGFLLSVSVVTSDLAPSPEPISLSLIATGLIGLGLVRRGRKKQ